jgi:DNA-binding MarR family transcriptional regulator
MSTQDRADAVVAARELMGAGQGIAMVAVALNSAVSQAMGLHSSEGLCLWHVTESVYGDPVTAGRLAELTGLTTGAITGIIDRLEAAGMVRRERDASDRRKVFIRPVPERVADLLRLFEPMEQAFAVLAREYQPDELAAILDYLARASQIMTEQIERLRASRSAGRDG